MELWFTERQNEAMSFSLRVRATLHHEKTPYQRLDVLDTEQYGRVLTLDGMVMTTEADEFVYHEMIVHVPLCIHPRPRRVLIVGGGDGGAVREALRHPEVERVDLVEIDRAVVEASRRFFPQLSAGLSDPKVRVVEADGIAFVAEHSAAYDCVLVDSTEPVGPAVGLFEPAFFRSVERALAPGGIMVAQTESPFVNGELIRRVQRGLREIFPVVRLYLASVPTYPSGLWSFSLAGREVDPERFREPTLNTRYYSPQVHRAAFALPPFVRELTEAAP
ncbi:MAG: polyamine aminopropyltransferase [Thermaerobacter sp.]|nr:polyamine aminopropyltransferase [Thermaerobacter sp.]